MCSIFGILDIQSDSQKYRSLALQQSQKQRHRGPDWSGIWTCDSAVLVHERLAIVDIETGEQPLLNKSQDIALLVNGEIYNHKDLEQSEIFSNRAADSESHYEFQTKSDCEIILALYQKDKHDGVELHTSLIEKRLNQLEGMFAFILFDTKSDRYIVARDPLGIIPLYYGYDEQQQLVVASELKALVDICQQVHSFPPGHYLDSRLGEIKPYYHPAWKSFDQVKNNQSSTDTIRTALSESVKKTHDVGCSIRRFAFRWIGFITHFSHRSAKCCKANRRRPTKPSLVATTPLICSRT
jgi:asparagine synthase (glutamine-hydrolysing)